MGNKKPRRLILHGLAGFFSCWWSWRDLNPRPENVYLWYYMLSLSFI